MSSNHAADYTEHATENGSPYISRLFYDPKKMVRIDPIRNRYARLVVRMFEEESIPPQYWQTVSEWENERIEARAKAQRWLDIFEPAWIAGAPLPTNEFGRVLVPWDDRERAALKESYTRVDALCRVMAAGEDGIIAPVEDPRRLLGKALSRLDELGVIYRICNHE